MYLIQLIADKSITKPFSEEINLIICTKRRNYFEILQKHIHSNYKFKVLNDQINQTENNINFLSDGLQLATSALQASRQNFLNSSSLLLRTIEERMYEGRFMIQNPEAHKYFQICTHRDLYYHSDTEDQQDESLDNLKQLISHYFPEIEYDKKSGNISDIMSSAALKRIKKHYSNWYQYKKIKSYNDLVASVLNYIDNAPKTKPRSIEYLTYAPKFRSFLNRCVHSGMINSDSLSYYDNNSLIIGPTEWSAERYDTYLDALIVYICGLLRNALWYSYSKKLDNDIEDILMENDLFLRCLRARSII